MTATTWPQQDEVYDGNGTGTCSWQLPHGGTCSHPVQPVLTAPEADHPADSAPHYYLHARGLTMRRTASRTDIQRSPDQQTGFRQGQEQGVE